MTLATLAATFAASFETAKRDDGTSYVRTKDDSPAWVRDIVQAAHQAGNVLPDDFRYRMTSEVADAINEALSYDADADLDDERHERIDGLIPVYNNDRLQWLASSLFRTAYCDDARENGVVAEDADMFDRIAAGIDEEYREIWDAVQRGLEEQAEEDDEETDEEPEA